MMFQTLTMPGDEVYGDTRDCPIADRSPLLDPGWPKMAFLEHRLAGDETNWWAANHAAVEAMLRSSGLRVIDRPGHEIYLCAPDPQARERRRTYASQYRAATGMADAKR